MSFHSLRSGGAVHRCLSLCLSFALLVALGLLAPSCSGDESASKSGSKKSKSSGSDEALADAKADLAKLIKLAKKHKVKTYDKKNYDRARKYRDAAKKDPDKALSNYKRAISALKKGVTNSKKVRKDLAAVETLLEEVEELRATLEKEGAAELAKEMFGEADKLLDEAIAALDKPDGGTARKAGDALSQAKLLYQDAGTQAKENLVLREQIDAKKSALEKLKEEGTNAGADQHALGTWSQGEQQIATAERMIAMADFRSALQSYQAAEQTYIRAIGEVKDAAQREADAAKQAKEQQEYFAQQAAGERERFERQAALEREKMKQQRELIESQGRPRGFAGGGDPFSTEVKPTLPAGLNPEDYDQGLDEEDEAFLAEHIDKLSKVISYDPETGAVLLNYRRGPDLRKDLGLDRKSRANAETLRAKKYLSFKNEFMEDTSVDMTDVNLRGQDQNQGPSRFTFECNTQGSFFLPVPFRWVANVTYSMQILTMDGNGSFNVLMMANPKRNDAYITDFIHLGKMSNGNQKWLKMMKGEFAQNANYWFEKKREVWMINEYMRPDPENPEGGIKKSGVFRVTYDAQEDATINQMPVKALERGYVGFRWFRVKAEVRKLVVTGIIDKEEAVKILRKRLKIKKSKKKKKKKTRVSSRETSKKDKDALASEGGKRKVGSREEFDLK